MFGYIAMSPQQYSRNKEKADLFLCYAKKNYEIFLPKAYAGKKGHTTGITTMDTIMQTITRPPPHFM